MTRPVGAGGSAHERLYPSVIAGAGPNLDPRARATRNPSGAGCRARRARAAESAAADPAGGEQLTPREAELLALFARGYSYKSAARELGISPLTVGGYVKAIYRKLEVNSRGEAVYAAVQRGQLNM